jgi:hypothetical protein
MPGFPAYCPNCGAIFQSRAIGFSGPITGVRFAGNLEGCVNCDKMARIIDGVFNADRDGVLALVSGPLISEAVLKAFNALVERAAKQEITEDELETEATQLAPELGELVSRAKAKQVGLAGLLILGLFIRSCNFKLDATVDINKLFDQWTNRGTKTEYVPSMRANVKDASQDKSTSHPKPSRNRPKVKRRK